MPANGKKPATKKSAPKRVATTKVVAKKKATKSGVIGLAMIALALVLSIGTYAYYQTTISGSVSGTILEWECKAGGAQSGNFALTLGDLYPGKTDTWTINLSVKNFKAQYTIGIDPQSVANVDNVVFKHGNDVLCKAANESGCLHTYTEVLDGGATGTASGSTVITYEWPEGTTAQTDNIPTTTTANSSTVDVKITCKQLNGTGEAPYGYRG